jgi:hypothetical protein
MVPTDTINIFQKNWAFTSADSPVSKIKTGTFGPCYVVSFTSGKYAAMAHIDDTTKVDSMKAIFDRFKQNLVPIKDIKVIILGGWNEHPESFKWGQKIVKRIHDEGFENVSTKNMYLKKTKTVFETVMKEDPIKANAPFYHLGALIDAKDGKTYILKEYNNELDTEQARQTHEFYKKWGHDIMSAEENMTEIPSP